ncbi:MmcQ/YjbR family DNA-binding protein [Sinorhizobium sp. BG8]|uniref:MmcQ/YjbR family DNA-binding protein n=1 Tax=Sinorhizobium sp. BG8 TaxID=2613773 RepID=UPI00193DAC50|nr:MmcQ/YjbR family DNA-binding protein [Sinorhizobium sp. BG8]QRM56856.1 MmcQ/YjbR family DNA-binding protein [Sinorhizobium sp. BG8]
MTSEEIARMALALPGALEDSHFGKRDFRVGSRIFLTLPEPGRAVCKLKPDQQAMLLETEPGLCAAVPGGWGAKGWTSLYFDSAEHDTISGIVETAWRNVAPKRLRAASGTDSDHPGLHA